MRFSLKNSSIFPIPGNSHMLHLGTIGYGFREFIVMHCKSGPHKGKTYIEEVCLNTVNFQDDLFANCKFIADDNLAQDLAAYAAENKLLDMESRLHQGGSLWIPGNKGLKI